MSRYRLRRLPRKLSKPNYFHTENPTAKILTLLSITMRGAFKNTTGHRFLFVAFYSPMNIGGPLRGWSTIIGPCGKTGVAGRIGRNRCRCGKQGGWHGPVTCGGAM